MTPEEIFFKYAYPCTEQKYFLNEITKDKLDEIKEHYKQNTTPDRKTLEEIYSYAIEQIKNHYGQIWDENIIRNYFTKTHNNIIEQNQSSSKTNKDYCKCRFGKVKGIKKELEEENIFTVQIKDKDEMVFGKKEYLNGDLVYIHRKQIIEKKNN